ncbi:MAG: hypothetical protein EBU80_11710, partial [Chitinophagia bacterium]|nr:hypothetical protein [Chitinophagia bacterium]
ILATVHDNPQMAEILRGQGHWVAQSSLREGGSELAAPEMVRHLKVLWGLWCENNLKDSRQMSPYTTRSSTIQLVGWAEKIINAST